MWARLAIRAAILVGLLLLVFVFGPPLLGYVMPFLLAFFFTWMTEPLLRLFQKLRMPRNIASIVIILILVAALGGILAAIVWFLCALLTVVREIKGLVICNVIILPVSYFGAYPLIRQFGMQGGSISLAVSYLIEIVALWIWLLRKVRQREKQHMEK